MKIAQCALAVVCYRVFLDGLRGIAARTVVLNSIPILTTFTRSRLSRRCVVDNEQKIEAIIALTTDQAWMNLCKTGVFRNESERLGGLAALTCVFRKAYKIARED